MTVELKNDLEIRGILVSVDQFLNIKLDDIKVVDEKRFPHMVSFRVMMIVCTGCTGSGRTALRRFGLWLVGRFGFVGLAAFRLEVVCIEWDG